jgi:hypothetical protein
LTNNQLTQYIYYTNNHILKSLKLGFKFQICQHQTESSTKFPHKTQQNQQQNQQRKSTRLLFSHQNPIKIELTNRDVSIFSKILKKTKGYKNENRNNNRRTPSATSGQPTAKKNEKTAAHRHSTTSTEKKRRATREQRQPNR